ncbi:MAG TPA: RNA methyltransferase [Solirubrobacteraceae bacterium]
MILYGRNPVKEALRGRRKHAIKEVWATVGVASEPWLQGTRIRSASAEEVERRCGSSAHQGVCADAGAYPYVGAGELLSGESPLIVALDQVQDPQNLGSICRTAECVGAAGVAILERRAAEVTPAVCKASAGAVEHLRITRVRNLADFLADARRAGCWCYGAGVPATAGARTAPAGGTQGASRQAPTARAPSDRGPVAYDTPDYSGGVVLVLGSEGAGLRPRVAKACDELIALPLLGAVESLGVSAAAAAMLYEILQNRERAS